jgi:hypothetical protein
MEKIHLYNSFIRSHHFALFKAAANFYTFKAT